MGTCPNHILEQSLENTLFLSIVPTKFKTELLLSPVSSNTIGATGQHKYKFSAMFTLNTRLYLKQ